MTSSNATSGKSRANTYTAIGLGLVAFVLVGFLLFRVDQMEKSFGFLRDNKISIEQQIANSQSSYDSIVGQVSVLEGKRNGLRVEIAGLEAGKDKLASMTGEIDKAAQRLNELQGDVVSAQSVISDSKTAKDIRDSVRAEEASIRNAIGDLNMQLSGLKGDVSETTSSAKDADRALIGLKSEVDRLKTQKLGLESEVAKLGQKKAEMTAIKLELKEKQQQVSELNAQVDGLKGQKGTANTDLANLQKNIELDGRNLDQTRNDAGKEQVKLAKLKQQISQQNGVLNQLAAAQESLRAANSDLANVEARLKAALNDLRQAEGLARTSTAEYNTAQANLTRKNAELMALVAEVAGQQKERDLAKQALSKINSEMAGLTQTEADLAQRVEKLRGDFKAEANRLTLVQGELAQARADRAGFETDKTKAAELTARIDKGNRNLKRLTADLANQKALLETASDVLADANRAAEVARNAESGAQAAVDRLNKEQAALQGEVAKLARRKNEATTTIQSMEQQTEATQKQLDRLRGQISKAESDLQTRSNELRRATRRLAEASTVLGNLDGEKTIAKNTLVGIQVRAKEVENELQQTQADLSAERNRLEAVQSQSTNPPDATLQLPASTDTTPAQVPTEETDQ